MNIKKGDHRAVCDVCGRLFWGSELQERWDGLLVDSDCWEPYHDGDRAPTIPEDTLVKNPRPRLINNNSAQYAPITADTPEEGLWYVKPSP